MDECPLDAPFPEDVLAKVRAHKAIQSAEKLKFDVAEA
jgi:D-3-phosphoglycerate dehydrogenase